MCMLCYVYIYSESSGDSILIGVENDPDFKNYKPSGNGIVLETSSMPYQNISHRNQLLDDGPEPESDCYPITPPLPRTAPSKRPSPPLPELVLKGGHPSEVLS